MTEERLIPCADPEACVGKSEPCANFEDCVKMSEPPAEEVIKNLRNELDTVREECSRLGQERDLLADMYARERFENLHLRDARRWTERNCQDMHEAAYELRRILFVDGKVRMSKETRAEISKYLSF